MNAFGWPDLLIAVVVVIGALMGFRRGFVAALTGIVAVVIAVYAGFQYGGAWDGWIAALTHLSAGSAHVVALSLWAISAYLITVIIGVILGGFARLPGLGFINALLGAGVGALEGAALLWLALYIALLFPLPKDVRADLARSPLVGMLTAQNARVDAAFTGLLPWLARPFANGFFSHHKP